MSALTIAIARLGSEAAVTDIAGSEGIYPIDFPQGALPPCVEVNVVSGFDESMLDGAGKYYRNRVTINCLAQTALGAEQLRNAVFGALQDNKNAVIAGFVDVSTSFANFERTTKSDDRSVYVWTLDFYIRWKAPA